jgi:hypothetical protein
MRRYLIAPGSLVALSLVLSACASATPTQAPPTQPPPEPTSPPEPTEIPFAPPEGALVAIAANAAPTLDGVADDAVWADAPATTVSTSGGANMGSSEVTLQAVYTADSVYFLVTWADPTESWLRSPWELQADGTWLKLVDPSDRGGDNNLYYEDKLAFLWPIANSIPNFETQGCFTACHAGENGDVKPYGNMYTTEDGQMADMWHWKNVRNVGQVDDQYLDSVRFSTDTREAGRHSDPKDSGGYVDNVTEDKTGPAFMGPADAARDGSPGYILDSEKLPMDATLFSAGDRVPGIIVSPISGDRGDISAGWAWTDGTWTLEIGRALVTGSEFDVQFDDLGASYSFGVAPFDNASVRHAFQTGATALVFQP